MLILVLAIIAGLIAAFLVHQTLRAPAKTSGFKIVFASRDIPYGAAITRDNLREVDWPWTQSDIPVGAFTSVTDAMKPEGMQRVALVEIAKNTPLLNQNLSRPGQKASLSATLNQNMKAVSVRVDDVRGVGGFIMPGDHVDVTMTLKQDSRSYTDTILQNIRVLAIDQINKDRPETAQVVKSVTLEVNTEDAQKIHLAQGSGGIIALVLRNPNDSTVEKVGRLNMGDLVPEFSNSSQMSQQGDQIGRRDPDLDDPRSLRNPRVRVFRGGDRNPEIWSGGVKEK
jgi:pilus assembly protein CpaB